jgi:hypothetical protein
VKIVPDVLVTSDGDGGGGSLVGLAATLTNSLRSWQPGGAPEQVTAGVAEDVVEDVTEVTEVADSASG